MESRNISLKKLKCTLVLFVMLISMFLPSFATTPVVVSTATPTTTTTLPYIEMKVKTVKVGNSNQVLVECWLSEVTNFEGAEILFTYDKTILQPSYINDINGHSANDELEGLADIKYEQRPEENKSPESQLEQEQFNANSRVLLSQSFAFESAYANLLDIDTFRYLATDGNNEALQFVMSKKEDTPDISTTDEVLIGTFSFRQTDGTTVDTGVFNTKRIRVICDDNPTGDLSEYTKEEANGDDCTEIIEFTYQKYGSISGTIYAAMPPYSTAYISKHIADIKIYEKEIVQDIDWTATKSAYSNQRNALPEPTITYATQAEDDGKFVIDSIPFGEYVILIDKTNYGDYIITNVILDSTCSVINLDEEIGKIELIAGDVGVKDGMLTAKDRSALTTGYNLKPTKDNSYDLTDDGLLKAPDRSGLLNIWDNYKNKEIKQVVSLVN